MRHQADPDLEPYFDAIAGKKATNLVALDVRKLSSVADTFIICSGRSNRQVSAIGEHIQSTLKDRGIRALNVEGLREGHWILLDYGHVIIHVFHEPVRAFYDLEGLWSDATRLALPSGHGLEGREGGVNDD